MKEAITIGAGRLGKGFIGGTIANSPVWNMTFIDTDPVVISNLGEAGSYHVTIYRSSRIEKHSISNFETYTWGQEVITDRMIQVDLIMFVIYPEKISEAVITLTDGLKVRKEKSPYQSLSIIFLTNKNHVVQGIHEQFSYMFTNIDHIWFSDHAVLCDSIIRRSTDAESNQSLNIRTAAVLPLLVQGLLDVDISDIEWMEITDQLELLKDVKIFIVDDPHVAGAFMGYYSGYETTNQISSGVNGSALISVVRKEIKASILAKYPLTEEQLDNLSVFPQVEGDMVDYTYRVVYDPIRKLSKGDRLSGSAPMCYENSLSYNYITKAIAYDSLYDNPDDPQALLLQESIQKKGLSSVVECITGSPKIHELHHTILQHYESLKRN